MNSITIVRIIIFSIALASFLNTSGQLIQKDTTDFTLVRSKDGSRFIGTLTCLDNIHTDLIISSGDTIKLRNENLIEREKYISKFHYSNDRFHYKHGAFFSLDFANLSSSNPRIWKVELSINYKLGERLSAGFGLGPLGVKKWIRNGELDENYDVDHSHTSFFINSRYYLIKNQLRFYGSGYLSYLSFGGSTTSSRTRGNLSGSAYGSFNGQYGLGVEFASRVSRKYFVQFSMNHILMKGKINFYNSENLTSFRYSEWVHAPSLSFGCQFYIFTRKNIVQYPQS